MMFYMCKYELCSSISSVPVSTIPLWPCLFRILGLDSVLLVKPNLESETNSYLELALPMKLNLDLGHFYCNFLKHLKVYFGGEADSQKQLRHLRESIGD